MFSTFPSRTSYLGFPLGEILGHATFPHSVLDYLYAPLGPDDITPGHRLFLHPEACHRPKWLSISMTTCLSRLREVQAHACYFCVDCKLMMPLFTSKSGQEITLWSTTTLPSQFLGAVARDLISSDHRFHSTPVLTL